MGKTDGDRRGRRGFRRGSVAPRPIPVRRRGPALLLAMALALASCKGGCGGCGGEQPAASSPSPPVPTDRVELTRGYAQRFPLGTHGILVARGFADVARSFETIKERIRPFFDLGAVESEIRNTFGVDLYHHVTFRDVGIAYDGGFALATVMQQPVLAFYLVDGAPLVAKANDVLRHQPFNLRAPVQRQHIGTADVYLYARRTNQPIEVAIMIDRGLGFVISRATPAVDLIDVARALAQTTPDHSLAAHPDFDTQVARFNDYPGFIFIDTEAASSFYRQRFSDQLSASGEQALDEVETNLRSLAGGARLEDLQLDVEAVLTVNPDLVAATAGIDAAPDEPPALGRFVLPSTFAAVRLGANPRLLWETFLRLQGDQLADRIRTHQDEIEHDLGVSLNDDVAPALTGQALVMVNRLAPLSLIRAESPADYADAVDFLAVFQLADRDRAVRVMDSLAAHSDGAYERTQDGDVLRYSTGRGASGFGNVLIGNHLLVVAADRMRRQAEQLIGLSPTAEATPGLTSLVPEAQALVSDNSATGLFLNFERLVPIAQLLNYPQAVRDLLGFLDTLVVRLETTETGLRIRGTLTFKPAEAE